MRYVYALVIGFVILMTASPLAAQFAGGSGTEADPYQVASAADLNNVRNYLSSHFIQTADIDLGMAPWNQGEGWVPIGTGSAFYGNFNGNEHYINGLYINRPGIAFQGLFSVLDNSDITNLSLENVQIIGGDYTGALAGIGRNWSSVLHSAISGSVQGDNLTGGYLGQLLMVSGFIDCKFTGSVNGDNSVGGFVGDSYSNDGAWNGIHSSLFQGEISGLDHVGGIIGSMGIRNVINKCVNIAQVSGNSFVGGLAGSGYHFNVDQSYNNGSVSGISVIGGIVGGSNGAFSSGIHYSYSQGIVTGNTEIGGLLGRGGGIGVNYSYWDMETSGIDHSIGGEGRTTDEMTYPYAANTYVGWDYDTIWHSDPASLNGGYPYLNEDWLSPTENDLDAVMLSGDTTPTVNTATVYSISVKNRGSVAQSEYSVNLFGSGNVELGSVAGTPISAGETLTYDISWTPSIEVSAAIYGKVILLSDTNPFNDQTNQLQVTVLPPYTLYFNDFESSLGNEWSNTTIATAPNGGEKFLGRFCNDTVTYTVSGIPAHTSLIIEFDLFLISTWDGNGPTGEFWQIVADGDTLLYSTFGNYGSVLQSYPDNYPSYHPKQTGAEEIDVLGYGTGDAGDSVYHLLFTFPHTSSSLQVALKAFGLEGIDNESWGIDNILITYSDQPIPGLNVSGHSGQMPFTVYFTDTSLPGLSPITSWAWDFDSNGTIDSNLQNPSWTYTQPGNYDVTLTVGDGTYTVLGTIENIIHVENTSLGNGLVGFYPFSGNSHDQSGRCNHGTEFGTVLTEDRYGRPDSACYFSGDGDYISIPETFVMHHPGDASFSIWLKRRDEGYRGIFWTRGDFSDTNRYNVYCGEDRQGFEIDYRDPDGALHMNQLNNHDAVAPLETWTHIVVSRIGNNYLIYQNGSLVKTDVDPNPYLPTTTGTWGIGNWASGFYGSMDDIRFYNRALNPTEIQRLYTMDSQSIEPLCRFSATPTSGVRPLQVQFTDESVPGLNPITSWAWDLNGDGEIESTLQNPSFVYPRPGTYTVTLTVSDGTHSNTLTQTDLIEVLLYDQHQVNTDNLSGYWPFNGNLNDQSNFNRNGSFVGSCSYVTDRYGNADGAVANANASSFIALPSFVTNRNATTIGVWYKATQAAISNGHYPIMSFFNNDIGTEYRIWQDNMSIGIEIHYPGLGGYASGTTGIVTGTWYHLTSVFENGQMYFYVNGSLINTTGYGEYSWHNAYPSEFLLGNYTFGNHDAPIIGIWDDLVVYDRALTGTEVLELFTANTDPSYVAYGVTNPTSNSRWLVGSYQNINWALEGNQTNINLVYSTDNGDFWTEIATSVPANQYSYNWMVPDTPSDSCKIRIKDRATPIVLYESELFEICRPSGFEGMVAHFPLDANTNDASGNANHGTNNGAVPTEDRFGSPNSAYSFDGNSYIHLNLQNGNMLDTSNTGAKTTVAFWMKWDGTDNMIVYGWYDFALWFYNGYFGFNSSNSDIYSIPSASFINNWVHVVAEFTNNSPYENELYINGVLQNLAMQNSYPLNVTIRNQARISGWLQNESYKFKGIIDDMYIFNRALNVDEVSDLYLGNLSILLAFIEPEATTSLITNSVQDIFWYADSTISTVDIEFSGDNGITWQMLADDLPAQQYHYNWTVPDTVATDCKLRITANTGETVIRGFSIIEAPIINPYLSISGRVVGSNDENAGLGGVSVHLLGFAYIVDSDGLGNFVFSNVEGNNQYTLEFSKAGYAPRQVTVIVPNYTYDLGTITLYENANIPTTVVATQVLTANSADINWSGAARSVLFSEAAEQGRAFLNYSLYRLLAGEEQNPATWTLVSTLSELVYTDPAWYAVPFGVYKYAVANNYSNGYQGVPVFSNELQRRNYTYSENFDHGGAAATGWTVTHTGTTIHPWMPVLDSGSDYSYKVMNTNLSTANETLLSPSYNCSRYEKVSVSFWHNYVPNVNSQARFQYSTNGVTWTTLFTYTSTANSGIKTYDISSAAHHQAAVRFRWLYTATSYNTNSWAIDDFSVYGYTTIPVYLSNPYPASVQRKVNSRTVELGITYIDDDMVNASSLYYRIDANGNGIYDTEESWIAIPGYANAPQIVARVNAAFQTDGYNLKYEFKGADLAGNAVAYSGSSHLNGISDDFSVDIDTVVPTAVNGFSLVSPGFQSATLAWQSVTELNFASYEIYYDTSRGVSLASNKWSASQDPALANINTATTTINILNTGINYWFRIRALDLHGNASELSPLLMYVTADLPPVISSPVPIAQPLSAWNAERTVTIGCTFSDYYGIDPASVEYRFDRNGNGIYDSTEGWTEIGTRNSLGVRNSNSALLKKSFQNPAAMDDAELELYMRNRNQMVIAMPVTFETDGPELRFEFKASDIHGVGPVYTGFYHQAGIDDDWFVRIDSINPSDIASIYIGVVNPSSIEVAWSRSNDTYFLTYEVYYATHPEVTTADQKWDWTNDPVLAYAGGDMVVSNITGLTDNTMYYFRVRAIDEAGNASPLSAEVNAFYGTSNPPVLPQNLLIQRVGDDVFLSWDPVTEDTSGNPITVSGYNIYASDLPDVVPDIGYLIDASTTTAYNHLGIAPFVDKIFYIVTAVLEQEVRTFDKPNDQRLRTKK